MRAEDVHAQRLAHFRAKADLWARRATLLSFARLLLFIAWAVCTAWGFTQPTAPVWLSAAGFALAFVVAVALHAGVVSRERNAQVRAELHRLHALRMAHRWRELPPDAPASVPKDHPYAHDLDVVGPASLLRRLDVTQTRQGHECLLDWLLQPSAATEIVARQQAVEELATLVDLRQELQAAASLARAQGPRFDATPLLAFASSPPLDRLKPLALLRLVPLLGAVLAISFWWLGWPSVWLAPWLLLQFVLAQMASAWASSTLEEASACQRHVEGFQSILQTLESQAPFRSPLLHELQARLGKEGSLAKALERLDAWVGLAHLRQQALLHFPLNAFLIWDAQVALGLERWKAAHASAVHAGVDAVARCEALASLAALRFEEPETCFPAIVDEGGLEAEKLSNPLLRAAQRVPNDLHLAGPASAWIVSGSNMAGKSTLLRSVGLNLVLAFAGGPVFASSMRTIALRLRAALKATDSLEEGASYFKAELNKLAIVLAELDREPPAFFLLDELLRGTNAHARAQGARAVLRHLLAHRALGLVTTHDLSLTRMDASETQRITNVHFTDVMVDGEMIFDYRLRPGVARHSNALHLLRRLGVEVAGVDEGEGASS